MYKQRNVTMEVRVRRRGEGEGVKGGKRREGRGWRGERMRREEKQRRRDVTSTRGKYK